MAFEIVVRTVADTLLAIQEVTQMDLTKPMVIIGKEHKEQRGLSANALSHVWYTIISKETGELEVDIKCECKLDYGVPILRGEDVEWNQFYHAASVDHFSREKQIKMMKYVPVTSMMIPEQMCRYLNAMQKSYAMNHGIILESKGAYQKWIEKNGYEGIT